MARTQSILALAMAAILLTAGCIGGGESKEEDPVPTQNAGPAGFDESTGGIEGSVTNDEGLPVTQAQVAVLQTEKTTFTDAAGRFVFSNMEPGRHAVAVQQLGYEAAVQNVEVAAGQATSVQFTLVTIVVNTPYHESIPKAGIFECTWRHPIGSGVCGYLGQVNETTGNPLEDHVFTNSERKWNYDSAPGTMTVINEMTWTPGSAATGTNLRIFFSYAARTPSHTFCQADGFSPLTMKWERDELDDDGECLTGGSGTPGDEPQTIDPENGLKIQTFVSIGATPTPAGGVSAAVALDQRFDIWFTMFYWEKAPEDFSALPDS